MIRDVLHKEPLINKVYVGNTPKIVPADIQNVPFVAIFKIVEVGKSRSHFFWRRKIRFLNNPIQ
ncbi:hypothetical protein AB96_3110 [Escherichia coli 8-415-05_S3_C1]|nr:hypothetical protein AB96_3110 [Escherichia coli 8-415-05_S3_C1]